EKIKTKKRKWYTLWLKEHEVIETRTKKIPIKKTKKGFKFESFEDTLIAFGESAGVAELEDEFRRWLRDGFERFSRELEKALDRGVAEYRRFLLQRFEELERKAQTEIASVEKHRDALEALTQQIEKARDWREFAR